MRITKDIVEQAKRLLQSWEKASKDVGVEKDKDYQIREIANLL